MTLLDRAKELIEKSKKATPGPWVYDDGSVITCAEQTAFLPWPGQCEYVKSDEDSEFIAACSPETIAQLAQALIEAVEVIELCARRGMHERIAPAREFLRKHTEVKE